MDRFIDRVNDNPVVSAAIVFGLIVAITGVVIGLRGGGTTAESADSASPAPVVVTEDDPADDIVAPAPAEEVAVEPVVEPDVEPAPAPAPVEEVVEPAPAPAPVEEVVEPAPAPAPAPVEEPDEEPAPAPAPVEEPDEEPAPAPAPAPIEEAEEDDGPVLDGPDSEPEVAEEPGPVEEDAPDEDAPDDDPVIIDVGEDLFAEPILDPDVADEGLIEFICPPMGALPEATDLVTVLGTSVDMNGDGVSEWAHLHEGDSGSRYLVVGSDWVKVDGPGASQPDILFATDFDGNGRDELWVGSENGAGQRYYEVVVFHTCLLRVVNDTPLTTGGFLTDQVVSCEVHDGAPALVQYAESLFDPTIRTVYRLDGANLVEVASQIVGDVPEPTTPEGQRSFDAQVDCSQWGPTLIFVPLPPIIPLPFPMP